MLKKWGQKLKAEYYKLLHASGSPTMIARGFALGLFIEFLTLPTLGIAFFLLYPLAAWFRTSFSVSLIGFVMGKFLVPVFFYWSYLVGSKLIPMKQSIVGVTPSNHFSIAWMKESGLAFLSGSVVIGSIVALVSFIIIYYILLYYRKRKVVNVKEPIK